jgi:hypothetical protein
MNTVSYKSMVKTVHVEKEFFNCNTVGTIPQPIIAMVSIYTELFENVSSGTLVKTNMIETCEKQLNGTFLGCTITVPSTALQPIKSCTTQPLFAPVRMNTVVATGPTSNPNVAETIEAEKEVFSCNPGPNGQPTTIEDVTIFTKILENINTGKTIGTKFAVSTCTKNIVNAFVACK